MPSSYTQPLYDGERISFEEFVLRCARGMGATVMLRDEPLDVLPTEENVQESGTYDGGKAAAAAVRLEALIEMTTEDAAEEAEREYAQKKRDYQTAQIDQYGLRRRYEHMREQVAAWEPPSEDHTAFKEFILFQLDEALRFDVYEPERPTALTPAGWMAREIKSAERDLAYHREQAEKRDERNATRAAWVKALRDSLEAVTA